MRCRTDCNFGTCALVNITRNSGQFFCRMYHKLFLKCKSDRWYKWGPVFFQRSNIHLENLKVRCFISSEVAKIFEALHASSLCIRITLLISGLHAQKHIYLRRQSEMNFFYISVFEKEHQFWCGASSFLKKLCHPVVSYIVIQKFGPKNVTKV